MSVRLISSPSFLKARSFSRSSTCSQDILKRHIFPQKLLQHTQAGDCVSRMPRGFEKPSWALPHVGTAVCWGEGVGFTAWLPQHSTGHQQPAAHSMPRLNVPKVEGELLPPSGRPVKTSVIFGTVPGRGNQKWILEICLLS